jgi:hypothetical protein
MAAEWNSEIMPQPMIPKRYFLAMMFPLVSN